jgi:DNA-binding NtrC family response regulator
MEESTTLDDDGVTELTDRRPDGEYVSFTLRVLQGPDIGFSLVLDGHKPLRALMGNSPTCEIRLADSKVSRRHAALEVIGGELHLTDLASTNGTFVDGVRVGDAFLTGGEVVQLGGTSIQIDRSGAAEPVEPLSTATSFGAIVGASLVMRRLYPLCERLAASDVPVIIEGETGTGKEVLAESLHRASPRAKGPFVVFDCTAVPATLMEAELFGHERGAFTGAAATRKGLIEQAEGGTLLIDELGDLDAALQPKLLRAVERHEIRRLGSDRVVHVNARIIAATRRDLDREVQGGRFRDDLFHRLAVARIELPPLRSRIGDVRVLAAHFCSEFGADGSRIPEDVMARWDDAWWPGNIRELRNSVARWLTLGEIVIHPESASRIRVTAAGSGKFDGLVAEMLAHKLSLAQARQRLLDAFDSVYIEQQLRENANHVGRAAAASGIGKRYFQMLRARHRSR